MDISRIEDMKGGWFAGNFEPSAWKTEAFEVAVHDYKKGEEKEAHYHKLGTEINLLLEGKFILRNYDGKGTDQELVKGDVFIIHPYEIADPLFLEDCKIVVVKTPSVQGDKYLVEND